MASGEAAIPIDYHYENDSAIDDVLSDSATETTSLASAITNYTYENGRRYHAYKQGEYWGPNDEGAQETIDISHHLCTLTLDGELFLAPIPDPEEVLDLGTGTGIWAIEFADRFPNAHVLGTDLSPIQPTWVPPKCRFEVDDFNDDWTFAKNHFDFIHLRSLFGCVPDWPKIYGQAYECLKPGGYIEQVEISVVFKSDDDTVNKDNILGQSGPIFIDAGKRMGKSFNIIDEMEDYIKDAGFEGVTLHSYRWPVGPWCKGQKLKEIGTWNQVHLIEGLEGYVTAILTRVCGWQLAEVQAWLARIRLALKNKDRQYHAYHDMKVVYGRKPLSSSTTTT